MNRVSEPSNANNIHLKGISKTWVFSAIRDQEEGFCLLHNDKTQGWSSLYPRLYMSHQQTQTSKYQVTISGLAYFISRY